MPVAARAPPETSLWMEMVNMKSYVSNRFNNSALVGLGLSFLLVPASAAAQEACGDSTCDPGYTCEVGPGLCPLILCLEGEECPPCEPEEQHFCAPADCDTDADCPDHMLCNSYETRDCPEETPTCSETDTEEECSAKWAAWEAQCVPGEAKECTPRWYLPCEVASDCGAGFECVQGESCSVAGSDPEQAKRDAASDAPVDVVCTPTEERYCQMIEQACESDSDCLENWSCAENPEGVCWADAEGGSGCEPADPAKICQPPQPDGYVTLAAQTDVVEDTVGAGAPATATDGEPTGQTGAPLDLVPSEEPAQSEAAGCSAANGSAGSSSGMWAAALGFAALAWSRQRNRTR